MTKNLTSPHVCRGLWCSLPIAGPVYVHVVWIDCIGLFSTQYALLSGTSFCCQWRGWINSHLYAHSCSRHLFSAGDTVISPSGLLEVCDVCLSWENVVCWRNGCWKLTRSCNACSCKVVHSCCFTILSKGHKMEITNVFLYTYHCELNAPHSLVWKTPRGRNLYEPLFLRGPIRNYASWCVGCVFTLGIHSVTQPPTWYSSICLRCMIFLCLH